MNRPLLMFLASTLFGCGLRWRSPLPSDPPHGKGWSAQLQGYDAAQTGFSTYGFGLKRKHLYVAPPLESDGELEILEPGALVTPAALDREATIEKEEAAR